MRLKAVSAEFERLAILGNVEERRFHKSGCLLPGSLCQHSKSVVLTCFGQAGICTYEGDILGTPVVESISKLLDAMFQGISVSTQVPSSSPCLTNRSRGIYVSDAKLLVDCTLTPNLKEAYCSQLDRAGDYICLSGSSRGAMTARALAGMVQKVGLLPPCNLEQSPLAYAMYARNDDAGRSLCSRFKQTLSTDVKIKLVGVWSLFDLPIDSISHVFAQGHSALC